MSLTQRKSRPIIRDKDSFRDDRLFIVACDDRYAPKQYWGFFRLSRIQVHVIPTEDGTSAAKHVLERLLMVEHADDDQLWMLLDTDHCIQGTHLQGFLTAIADARQRGVQVALSKPCFELWLLLHYVDESKIQALANAEEVEKLLRNTLGEYNKTNLKSRYFPLSSVAAAIERAIRHDMTIEGGDVPTSNTTRVYKLWQEILTSSPLSQIPDPLQGIASQLKEREI